MLSFPKTLALANGGDRPIVVLKDGHGWVYEGTDIPAVGARDITLGEAVNPLRVSRVNEEPEAVLIPLSTIIEDERLNWVLQAGRKLDGDDEPMFKLPWSVWQEHAEEPIDAWLPEWDAAGLDRSLARAERAFRFARQALDDAGAARQRLIVLAVRLGKSKSATGRALGLSTVRVQQLNDDPPQEVLSEVDDFLQAAARVAGLLGTDPCPRENLPDSGDLGGDGLDEVITAMLATGLLEQRPEGLLLTDDGRQALADHDGSAAGPNSGTEQPSDRERSSNAAR